MPEIPPPSWQFQPWEYGDPWVKQTYTTHPERSQPGAHRLYVEQLEARTRKNTRGLCPRIL